MAKARRHAKRLAHEVAQGIMHPQDVKRKYDELIKRFKEIQVRFETATTDKARQQALKEMRALSNETHALLNRGYTRLTGA